MAVPVYKRTEARSEFVNQGHIVMKQTEEILRKWPKSRKETETDFVVRIAQEVHEKAVMADTVYCILPNEFANRLNLLYEAYGKINVLASYCDGWILDTPTIRNKKEEIERGKPEFIPAVAEKKLENFSGTLSKAMGVFSGAIRRTRDDMKKSLEKYPQFSVTLPVME